MKTRTHFFKRFFKKHPWRFLGVFVLLVLGIGAYSSGQRIARRVNSMFFACPVVDVVCNDCYSPLMKKELVSFVRAHMAHVNYLYFDAQNFYSSLKDQFDCVSKVTISKRLPLGFCVNINGVKPVMLVNNTSVLAADCGVYPRENFTAWPRLEQLPNIDVPSLHVGMKVSSWAYDLLQKLAIEYAGEYVCCFKNSSYICLTPRCTGSTWLPPKRYAALILNEASLKNKAILQHLDVLIDDAFNRGFCSQAMVEKKRRSVELDLRFERRIIMKFIDHSKRGRVS